MRVVAPVLGPVLTADLRVLIGGGALWVYFKVTGFDLQWRRHWKQFLVVGLSNAAIPFLMYAFAARHIPASYSAILNSAAPMFGAIFSAIWLNDRLTMSRITGLVIGFIGVTLVANVKPTEVDSYFVVAIVACLIATVCYGFNAAYVKRFAQKTPPRAIACASQLVGALILLPIVPLGGTPGPISMIVILNLLGLALICSAVAFLMYYRLIANIGATKALTVAFLMPAFGMFWGALFLGEKITLPMIAGTLLILLGTGLVLKVFRRTA